MKKETQIPNKRKEIPMECIYCIIKYLNENGVFLGFPNVQSGQETFLLGLTSTYKGSSPPPRIIKLIKKKEEYYCYIVKKDGDNKAIKKQYIIAKDAAEKVLQPFLEHMKTDKRAIAAMKFIVKNADQIKPLIESFSKRRAEKYQAIKDGKFETAAEKRDEEKKIRDEIHTLIITLTKGKRNIKAEWVIKYFADEGMPIIGSTKDMIIINSYRSPSFWRAFFIKEKSAGLGRLRTGLQSTEGFFDFFFDPKAKKKCPAGEAIKKRK